MTGYRREFSIIHRYSRMYMSRAMENYGISGRLIPYVMFICNNPATTQEAIARTFHIDKGAVARTIALLMEKGLVVRKENPDNKRENLLFPAEEMLKISERVRDAEDELEEVLNHGLSTAEQEQMEVLLEKMASNLIQAVGKEVYLSDKDH